MLSLSLLPSSFYILNFLSSSSRSCAVASRTIHSRLSSFMATKTQNQWSVSMNMKVKMKEFLTRSRGFELPLSARIVEVVVSSLLVR